MVTQHVILADHERRLFSIVYACLKLGFLWKNAKKKKQSLTKASVVLGEASERKECISMTWNFRTESYENESGKMTDNMNEEHETEY